MAIDPKNNNEQVMLRGFQEAKRRLGQTIINTLIFVGETFVRNARLNGDYNDITGNLRSSIGYLILNDGIEVTIAGFEGTAEGINRGQSFIRNIGANYPSGYVLIVVAGMEYAAQVESRGRDVLTGSGIEAKNQLRDILDSIRK